MLLIFLKSAYFCGVRSNVCFCYDLKAFVCIGYISLVCFFSGYCLEYCDFA